MVFSVLEPQGDGTRPVLTKPTATAGPGSPDSYYSCSSSSWAADWGTS